MIKEIYKQKGWIATSASILQNRIEVKLTFDGRYNFYCPTCGCNLKIHSYREINVRDLPILEREVLLYVDTMQGYCDKCKRFHTLRPDICHPTCGFTWRFMRLLSRHLIHAPARYLQDEYKVSYTTVLRLDKEVLKEDIAKPKTRDVESILIDEKYLGASSGFVTMVLNAKTGEPLELTRGRDGNCLDDFFKRFGEQEKRKIKYLGIDRSNAYRSAALQHLPHIHICYDAYHLVSNMNEVLDRIRRSIMKNAPYGLEKFLKGKRYILLKGRENLPSDARQELRSLYTLNKGLYIAYLLKEQFRQIFQTDDENTATLRLILWIKMCMKSKVKQLIHFAKGISSKFNEIINGIRYKINSAKIEAANAMIKRIQSKACGIFDVEYLFLKLRQIYYLRLQKQTKMPMSYYQQI